MEETFSIDIRPTPYHNDRVERGLQGFCQKVWAIPQFGSAMIYKGIYTGIEDDMKTLLYSETVWPALDEVRYWRRPEHVYYTLRQNVEPYDEKRPWKSYGDISTACWVLDPDQWYPGDPFNCFPVGDRTSYESAIMFLKQTYPGAIWLNDDYFACECGERKQLRKP